MLAGILPPRPKGLLVVVSAVSVVVKPQTEASSSQSKWPDFGVLSMAADRRRKPLLAQMIGDLGVGPLKRIVAVSDHLERLIPAIVAVDHRPDTQQNEEEPLVEQHAVGLHRVHLAAVGLDAVCRPARGVVFAPQLGRNEHAVGVGIVGLIRIVPELGQPVSGGPPAGMALDELVQDGNVGLGPRGGAMCHEPHGVGRVDQVETMPACHRRIGTIIPMRMRRTASVPVVGGVGLAV